MFKELECGEMVLCVNKRERGGERGRKQFVARFRSTPYLGKVGALLHYVTSPCELSAT